MASEVTTSISFLKQHERLILVLALIAASFVGFGKYVNYMSARDTAKAQVTEQVLQTQIDKNAALAQQAQQNAQQYQALLAQVTAQNQALQLAIAARNTQTQKQQQTDTTLPLPQLAARWISLASLPPDSIKPSADGVDVPADAAVKTTQQLELIPTLQQNINDLQTTSTNKDKQITSLSGEVDTLNKQISGLDQTVTDANNNTKAQVAACEANAKKSRNKWAKISFVVGYIAGFASRQAIK